MTCDECGHGRGWHDERNGCLWLSLPGVKGCPCMTFVQAPGGAA